MPYITIFVIDKIEAFLRVEARSAQRFNPAKSPTDLTTDISVAIRAIFRNKLFWLASAKVFRHSTNRNVCVFEEISACTEWVIHEYHILAYEATSSRIRLHRCAAIDTAILSL